MKVPSTILAQNTLRSIIRCTRWALGDAMLPAVLLFTPISAVGQVPVREPVRAGGWAEAIGGSGVDHYWSVETFGNGKMLAAGDTTLGPGIVNLGPDGQVLWQERLDASGGVSYAGMTRAHDGGAFLALLSQTSVSQISVGVVRLDQAGALVWAKLIGPLTWPGPGSFGGPAVSMSPASDGGVYFAMSIHDGAGNVSPLIGRLDPGGSLVWLRSASISADSWGNYVYSIATSPNGGLHVVCESVSYYSTPPFWVFGVLYLLLAQDGSVIVHRLYHAPAKLTPLSLDGTGDGGAVITGDRYLPGDIPRVWAMRLDPAGAIVWDSLYTPSINWADARAVTSMPSGDLALTGLFNGPNGVFVTRLDPAGVPIWCNVYSPPPSALWAQGWAIASYGQGELAVSGIFLDRSPQKSAQGLVMRTEPDGRVNFSPSSGFYSQPIQLSRSAANVQEFGVSVFDFGVSALETTWSVSIITTSYGVTHL